jgi:hypothetical protein
MFSHALFMSSSTFKFSRAANLFVISIWNFSLTSSSFSFLRLNLPPLNFCTTCLLIARLSLTFATARWWSVSQSALLKLHTSSMLGCRLLSVHTWSIWLWVFPSGEVQLYLWMFRWGNIVPFTAALHIGGRSSIRNLRTRHAIVTGGHTFMAIRTVNSDKRLCERSEFRISVVCVFFFKTLSYNWTHVEST